jgi:peroxiredoxin
MFKRSLTAVAAAGLLFCATAASQAAVEIGQAAPEFSLVDQHGKTVKLSDFVGKIVVLEWFNEECPYVKKHYTGGAMNATAAKYAEKGVVWLAVNSTSAADVARNLKAATDWKMDRPILDDHTGKVGHAYDAKNTPHVFIIDGQGKLIYRGAIDSKPSSSSADISSATNYAAKALDEALAGKPVSQSETKPYGCTVKYAK